MEEESAWEGERDHEHDSSSEDEVGNDGPVERSSEAGEDLTPSQEPTSGSLQVPSQRATPNVEELTEVPLAAIEMAMDVDATVGLETLMNAQEESTLRHGTAAGNGEF